jgi:stearoyl-CoA desaturase (delta-9 desaturase)
VPSTTSSGITQYAFNEPRPRSDFRPVLFSFVLTVHLLAVGAVLWHLVAGFWPSPVVLWTAGVLYAFTGFGIALGYHRLFTHDGYECGPVVKAILLIAGGLSLEGAVDNWVRTHKYHHAYSDKPGDPHTPFQYGGSFWLALKGVAWSHMGWLFYQYRLPARKNPDRMDKDRMVQFQSRHYLWIVIGTFALPTLICAASGLITDGWRGMLLQGLDGALIAGVLRVLLLLHVTWSINSVCHLWGQRMTVNVIKPSGEKIHYPSDGSRNAYGLKLLSFGEANHAMHHLFQKVAFHGWRWWSIDPAKWVLIGMEKLRLARNVERPPKFEVVRPTEVRLPEDSLIREREPQPELTSV